MFKNQPAGLYVLSLANTGERFGYYTMLAIFLLFLQAKFGFDSTISGQIYAGFLALVYFMRRLGSLQMELFKMRCHRHSRNVYRLPRNVDTHRHP